MPSFLHVGCGRKPKRLTTAGLAKPEWREVRFDIDPEVRPDIVGTMLDMSQVETASMDAVYSSHNIEHVYLHEAPQVMAEFLRVLKPDGFAVVNCPDMQSLAGAVAQGRLVEPLYMSSVGPISAHDSIYGYGVDMAAGNLFMAHRSGYVATSLMQLMKTAGFGSVGLMRRVRFFDLWAVATKQRVSQEVLQPLLQAHFPPLDA